MNLDINPGESLGGREGGREGGRKEGRKGGREAGREGGRDRGCTGILLTFGWCKIMVVFVAFFYVCLIVADFIIFRLSLLLFYKSKYYYRQ